MPKFESHITCPAHAAAAVKDVGEVYGWKFSCITGDALLGNKPYCYLTRYEPDEKALVKEMIGVVNALSALDVLVIRQKIERIIFDTKTGVNELYEVVKACPFKVNSRRLYYADIPDYYESDNDFVANNMDAALWLLDNELDEG